MEQKILIVDDFIINLKFFKACFEYEDIEVFVESDSRNIEKVVKETKPDLILLDINMPYFNGFEIIKILKSNTKTANIPVIFLTALKSNSLKKEAFECGAVDYIEKPFVDTEIVARAKIHLKISRLQQKLKNQNNQLLKVNEQVKLSEQKYRNLYNNLSLPYCTLNFQAQITEVNQFWFDELGYSEEELINHSLTEFIHKEDIGIFNKTFKNLENKPALNIELRIKHKNGDWLNFLLDTNIEVNNTDTEKNYYCVLKNITDRIKSEQIIKSKNEFLKHSQQIGNVGSWEYDLVKNKLIWSEQVYRIFEQKLNEEVSYDSFIKRVHPDDKDCLENKWINAVSKGEGYEIEHRIICNGKVKWVKEKSSFTRDKNGNAILAIGFVSDITEQKAKQTELENLLSREKKLADIIRDSPLGIAIGDEDGCYSFVNPEFQKLTEYSQKELSLLSWTDLTPKKWHLLNTEYINKIKYPGDSVKFEKEYITKSGKVFPVEVTLTAVFSTENEIQNYIGFFTDISLEKEKEEKIKEISFLNQKIIEHSPFGIWIFEEDGTCIKSNNALAKAVGTKLENVKKLNFRKIKTWQNNGMLEIALKALNTNKAYDVELNDTTTFGRAINFVCHFIPIFTSNKKRLLVSLIDLTKEKNRQRQLARSNKKISSILRTAPIGIGIISNHILEKANVSFYNILGYSKAEIIGQHISMVYTSKDLYEKQNTSQIPNRNKLGEIKYESFWKKKDGSIINVLITSAPVEPFDSNTDIVFTVTDITEQKSNEAKLKETYKIITSSSTVLFTWQNNENWDAKYVTTNVNKIFGWFANDFLTGKTNYASVIYDKDLQRIKDEVEQNVFIDKKNYFVHKPYRIVAKDKTIKWVSDRTNVIRDKNGDVIFFQGVIEDITPRIVAEKKLILSELQSKTILNTSDDIITLCSPNFTFQYMNKKAKEVLNYKSNKKCYNAFFGKEKPCTWCKLNNSSISSNQEVYNEITDKYYLVSQSIIKIGDSAESLLSIYKDISIVKQAEFERNKLFSVLNTGLNEIYIIDIIDNIIEYASKQALKNLGYTTDELKMMKINNIQHEINSQWFVDSLSQLINKETDIIEYQTAHKRKNGSIYPVEVSMKYLEQDKKNVILLNVTDVSEKLANRHEINILSKGIAQSPINVVITNKSGLIEYVNPQFEKITGYTFEEAKSKNPRILKSGFHNDQFYDNMWRTISQGKTWHGEIHNKSKANTFFWEEATISPVKNHKGEIQNYIAVKKDITERKLIEQSLKKTEKQLKKVTEVINQPVFAINKKLEIIEWNIYIENLTGYTKREIINLDYLLKIVSEPKDLNTRIKQALKGKSIENLNLKLKTKDKREVVSLFINSLSNPSINSEKSELMLIGQDVTELNNNKTMLEVEVKKRTLELSIALEKERELNELKSKFVSMASHEFRTPLAAINFSSNYLKKYWERIPEEKRAQKFTKIENQVNHMTSLLNDVLTFGEIESKNILVKLKTVDAKMYFTQLINEFSEANYIAQKISLNLMLEIKLVKIDLKISRNIFINLLSNAVKFSSGAKKIDFEVILTNTLLTVKVTDYGIGIPKDELKSLFDPFHRASNAETVQGTGLGLAIVKENIDLLNGTISVKSVLGKKTCFTVKIPQ